MFKTSLKGILAHKGRVLTTAIAVMLGVAFVAGTLVLSDTILKVFDDLFADVNEGTDAAVRVRSDVADDFGQDLRSRVDAGALPVVIGTPGVHEAEGSVAGFAQYVDKDGEAIGNPGQGAPTLGFSWNEVPQLNPWVFVDGEQPRGPDQVVMDKHTADENDFHVGDEVTVLTKDGSDQFDLVGIVRFGTADSPAGATVALFDIATAQNLLAEPGRFDQISVVADEGVSQEDLARTLRTHLRDQGNLYDDTEVLTGAELTEETQNQIEDNLGFFTTALLAFAVVALIVGAFVIYNTFGIIVAQRGREMALLRAIGASRRQVLGSVLIEAVIVGLVGAVLGLVLGIFLAIGLQSLLNAFGLDIPSGTTVVTTGTIVISLVLGMVVTVVAAMSPARRASKVAPVAAMRDVALDTSGRSRTRLLAGLLVTALGVASLASGLFGGGDNALSMVGLGAALVFVGVTVLGPVIAAPVTRVIGWPLPRIKKMTGTLARENALRNPKRTSATAAALMIGVGLVGFITIFADSAKASIEKIVDDSFTGDFVLDSGSFGFGGVSPELADQLNELPEVDAATGIRLGFARLFGGDKSLVGVDPETAFDIVDVGVLDGSPEQLDENGIALHEDVAADHDLQVGDPVPITFAETGRQQFEVGMIYSENQLAGDQFIGRSAYEANYADQLDFQVYVITAPDVSQDQARTAIEGVAGAFPNVEVQDLSEFKKAQTDQINQFLFMIYALLGLAIVIALFGIANTLALSIIERTRELGLLRAVGMTRRQLKSAVRWEAVLISVFGTLLGLVIGLFFGWVLVKALEDEGFTIFQIPVGQLAIVVVVAALAGVVAAILPARRAARLNVLEAVFSE